MAKGKRPVPFRTRKLSLSAPMVLRGRLRGRVGRRRTYLVERGHLRVAPLYACPGSLSNVEEVQWFRLPNVALIGPRPSKAAPTALAPSNPAVEALPPVRGRLLSGGPAQVWRAHDEARGLGRPAVLAGPSRRGPANLSALSGRRDATQGSEGQRVSARHTETRRAGGAAPPLGVRPRPVGEVSDQSRSARPARADVVGLTAPLHPVRALPRAEAMGSEPPVPRGHQRRPLAPPSAGHQASDRLGRLQSRAPDSHTRTRLPGTGNQIAPTRPPGATRGRLAVTPGVPSEPGTAPVLLSDQPSGRRPPSGVSDLPQAILRRVSVPLTMIAGHQQAAGRGMERLLVRPAGRSLSAGIRASRMRIESTAGRVSGPGGLTQRRLRRCPNR